MIESNRIIHRIEAGGILLAVIVMVQATVHAQTASSEETDNTRYLEEVVVESRRGRVEDGKIVFVPTKKEKQLANSAVTLIQSMSLPILRVENGAIKTANGGDVKIYINGRPADEVDLATFWPLHARCVEYMVNPQEGEFAGDRNVVNFVMTDYEIGGITKINVIQEYPLSGDYNVASKFVYKGSFTLGALVDANFTDYNMNSSSGAETFRNLYYNHMFYDEIKNEEKVSGATKNHGVSGAIVQKYFTQKFGCMHQLKFRWSKYPGILSEGEKVWTPGLFGDDYYGRYSESSSVVPGVSGMYRWVISPRWYLNGEWQYTYSRNKYAAWDKTGEMSAIDNGTSESVNSFSFKITPTFILSPKFTFNYVLTGDFTNYSTDYSGSTSAACIQRRQDIDNYLGCWWNITGSLYVYASPRLSFSLWQIEPVKEKQINPSVSVGGQWSANSKLDLSAEVQFNRYSANPNELNPVLVQSSELMWLKGNPYLHNSDMWSGYLGINYLPFNRLSLSLHNNYSKTGGGTLFEYTPMDESNGGLLKTAYNTSSGDRFTSTLGVNTSFFERKLTLHLQGSYAYTSESMTRINMHTFDWRVDASYTLGNVRLSVNYRSPMKSLSNGGRQTTRISSNLDVSLTYGLKQLYMDFTVYNIFHKYSKQSVVYQSPNYSFSSENLSLGRVICLNLTYTFGYGKEITPQIEASIPDAKSSVLH